MTCYHHSHKPIMAIIKANGYGHGAKEVALAVEKMQEIAMFGVATLKEALDLRTSGIEKPILVLGAIRHQDVKIAIKHHITLTLFSLEYIDAIIQHVQDDQLEVHLKIDTGMNRLGFKDDKEIAQALARLQHHHVVITGVFTHYADADENEEDYLLQLSRFKALTKHLNVPWIHASNSAATLYYDEDYTNMVRCGIAMYGVDPSGNENPELKQVMSLYTRVVMVKKIHRHEKVGYGLTYEAKQDEYIATLPIGYADGLIRLNQGRYVYIRGRTYEIIGRVCMDQMMVRVDETIQAGDLVEIFGDHIPLFQMAKELHTIPYEILCLLSERVERVYHFEAIDASSK